MTVGLRGLSRTVPERKLGGAWVRPGSTSRVNHPHTCGDGEAGGGLHVTAGSHHPRAAAMQRRGQRRPRLRAANGAAGGAAADVVGDDLGPRRGGCRDLEQRHRRGGQVLDADAERAVGGLDRREVEGREAPAPTGTDLRRRRRRDAVPQAEAVAAAPLQADSPGVRVRSSASFQAPCRRQHQGHGLGLSAMCPCGVTTQGALLWCTHANLLSSQQMFWGDCMRAQLATQVTVKVCLQARVHTFQARYRR